MTASAEYVSLNINDITLSFLVLFALPRYPAIAGRALRTRSRKVSRSDVAAGPLAGCVPAEEPAPTLIAFSISRSRGNVAALSKAISTAMRWCSARLTTSSSRMSRLAIRRSSEYENFFAISSEPMTSPFPPAEKRSMLRTKLSRSRKRSLKSRPLSAASLSASMMPA